MAHQIPFTKYEAVLLLDGYLDTVYSNIPKMTAVKRVSEDLRRMAVNNGQSIHESYRSTSGIAYQINCMESAYLGYTITAPPSKLFLEIVKLYKNDGAKYSELLKEAKNMINEPKSIKEQFTEWLNTKVPPTHLSEIYLCYYSIEAFCLKLKILKQPLFETADLETVKKVQKVVTEDRLFQIQHKKQMKKIVSAAQYYTAFIKEINNKVAEEKPIVKEVTAKPEAPVVLESFTDKQKTINNEDFIRSEADQALQEKYPILFKKVYISLSAHAEPVSVEILQKEIGMFFHFADIVSILMQASWSKECTHGEYCYSKEIISHNKVSSFKPDSMIKKDSGISKFLDEKTFYRYLTEDANLAEATSRSYVSAIRNIEYYAKVHGYDQIQIYGQTPNVIKNFYYKLFNDKDFIEYNNQQHNRFRAAMKKMLEFAGDEIPSRTKDSPNTFVVHAASADKNPEIVSVLKQHYEYGFKYDSIRELMRFRQFAEAMGITLPDDDENLKSLISACGTIIDGKVYCKSDDMPRELQKIVDNIFSMGIGVIYYDCLFENENTFMESYVITSPDMLKEYLQKYIIGYSFSKRFMIKGDRITEKEAVTGELKRVWGIGPSVSVDELRNRLPYIPIENIWRVISGNDSFVLNEESEYLLIDRFRITGDEEQDILDYVEETCEENGFTSLTDVPLGDIEEENYELTQLAIYNAIYKKVLSGRYHINGKILTKENSELDAVVLLKQYIKGKDECSFVEVADKVVELTGGTNRQYAFQALYDDMVRVDKNRFVANRFVIFNVDEIDSILSGFITENFRAIRDVTTFAMFPFCGQSWNHYLLESFCYKYSRKFSLHVIHFNDKNAGIIAEKSYNKSYNEMLAIALAKTNVELSADTIGQYLFDTGYMAKSKYAKLNEIAQRAIELRNER